MESIKLSIQTKFGSPGTDEDQFNPLARAIRSLLEDGKPFKGITSVFLETDNMPHCHRWFGSFIHSYGDRILFFPGLRIGNVMLGLHGSATQQISFQVDHISLEPDLKSWHITEVNKNRRQGGFLTYTIGEERFLWFGLSAQNTSVFHVLKRSTHVVTQCPLNDSRRRAKAYDIAAQQDKSPTIAIPSKAFAENELEFVHFAVVVGPKNSIPYDGPELCTPKNTNPTVANEGQPAQHYSGVRQILALGDKYDLQILITSLPGKLKNQVSFTSK